jgi:cytoskeletal protein CcmA (bactofilin family)
MLNVATKVSEATSELIESASRTHGREAGPELGHSHMVSVLGGGMTVTGDVTGEGELRIEGRVEGSVTTTGRVVVNADGEVAGGIEAQEVVASGKVSGTISARGGVRLRKGCQIEADIEAATIEIEDGGVVNGRITMTKGK